MWTRVLRIRIFDLEAHGACNLACPFCPRDQLPPTGAMSQETFTKFLDHVPLGQGDTISFVGVGEPTLNNRLPDFIRQAKQRYPSVLTWITTNGTTLNERVLPPLLEAGLDTLDISSNGIEKEEYERLMKGATFENTVAHVEYAVKEIAQRGAPTQLRVNYIVTQENRDQEQRIQNFWRARGVRLFRPQWMHDRSGLTQVEGMTPLDPPGLRCRTCSKFEIMPIITWKGDVLYCSHDIRRAHKIGNIREHTWKDIHTRKKRIVREQNWPQMCTDCTDSQRHDMREKVDEMVWQHLRDKVSQGVRTTAGALKDLVKV